MKFNGTFTANHNQWELSGLFSSFHYKCMTIDWMLMSTATSSSFSKQLASSNNRSEKDHPTALLWVKLISIHTTTECSFVRLDLLHKHQSQSRSVSSVVNDHGQLIVHAASQATRGAQRQSMPLLRERRMPLRRHLLLLACDHQSAVCSAPTSDVQVLRDGQLPLRRPLLQCSLTAYHVVASRPQVYASNQLLFSASNVFNGTFQSQSILEWIRHFWTQWLSSLNHQPDLIWLQILRSRCLFEFWLFGEMILCYLSQISCFLSKQNCSR
jgi:hypothetical protein